MAGAVKQSATIRKENNVLHKYLKEPALKAELLCTEHTIFNEH